MALTVVGCSTPTPSGTGTTPAAAPQAAAADLAELASDAYVFAYPLVTMEMTRRVMTNEAEVKGTRGPMGHLVRLRVYPDAQFRDVTAPNADTLYTTGWFDVGKEPYVLTIPDSKDRYYLFPMLDGWTNVFEVPGKRTTGTAAQTYAITGPGWTGTLPAGVKELKSPTAIVWILGRIYCTGTPEDYKAVYAMQDAISVVPLSAYGKPYTPPAGTVDATIDMKTAVREQVHALDAASYFKLFAQLMKANPPAAADAPILARIAKLGLVPGQDFDISKLDPETAQALNGAPTPAQGRIMTNLRNIGESVNGWDYSTKLGVYGTNYLNRATVTAIGLGANRSLDAIYPTAEVDAEGQSFSGDHKYVLHFDKGQTPPAEGFWSLTMYDDKYFFVDNPLNRYTVSSRFNFKHNADGSLDLYIQKDSPGKDKEANWLPAPAGKFILMMRLYWPRETPPSLIDGTWRIPGVKKVPTT
jgi:hypothetical protein